MFPSTGHFRFFPCPFHSEGHCGRVYCHYRHVKNSGAEKVPNDNAELAELEKEVCGVLKMDRETFNIMVNEEDENVHEKLVNNKLKIKFTNQGGLIDDFHFPESLDDTGFSSTSFPTDTGTEELINLAEDTSLDEGPLKQFLEEDAKQNISPENKSRNTMEKRHMIISCLEKIDKRDGSRSIVQPKSYSNASVRSLVAPSETDIPENTDDIATQPLFSDSLPNLKQEASDDSESEDNAEVDKILSQIKLLNPELFCPDKVEPFKNEPTNSDLEDDSINDDCADISSSQTTPPLPSQNSSKTVDNRVGRINLKSIVAINNEYGFSSRANRSVHSRSESLYEPACVRNDKPYEPACVRSDRPYEPASVVSIHPTPESIVLAATIAEQNRLKNVFKNTICSNIDQFFDMSDACKVYGTEIFNLLEPLLNYIIEKLNPEFNYEKLRQLHSQNMSLSCALPFVMSCDHTTNCIECHNLVMAAMSRNKIKKANKSTETDPSNDTPLRKIEAGLHDITKEMLSLGLPTDNHLVPKVKVDTRNISCQTSERGEKHSSHREHSHRHSSRRSNDKHDSKSRDRHDNRKHSSSSSKHSRSDRHSSKSHSTSSRKHEKRRKTDESEDCTGSEDDHSSSKHARSSKSEDRTRKKRPSSDKSSSEDDHSSSKHARSSKNEDTIRKKRPSSDKSSVVVEKKPRTNAEHEHNVSENVNQSDNEFEYNGGNDDDDLFGAPLSDDETSGSESAGESKSVDSEKPKSTSQDSEDEESEDEEKPNSDEFVAQYPTTANKKRVSHVNDGNKSQVYRKQVMKKHIPTPAEAMHQRMQSKRNEEISSLFNTGGSSSERVRISRVPNVALLLKAQEKMKHDMVQKQVAPVRTIAQTAVRGQRIAHAIAEPPKPKDIPPQAHLIRPTITEFKSSHNIPTHIRQTGLDKLYNAFAKKVPAEMASTLALKEEQTIHEKVTIQKVYLNSLAMAVHRIAKETPAKLLEKTSEYPQEINGLRIYDLLSKHLLTYEQLEINGFPLPHPSKPRCCRISTKAIHYKPLSQKRSGRSYYCQQCKELFDVDPETGLPITPITGCRFHQMRPRKEPGRTRHELYYPCCNSGISESGCMTAEHHTPDTTDDDCLKGFIETRDPPPGERGTKRIYSLDCEMCATTEGAELTRVTVIGYDCNTVYDSLVKPRNPILDYCTKFSGITEEKLRRVSKTLEQVRDELFKFIFKDSILIGHSLENDLKALKILHYKIVDTSVMYPHRDAPERKFSLKNLSANVVQFLIQESEFGHDSKEDALACMKLVWKKIREDAQIYRRKTIISSPAAKNLV